MTVSEIRTAYLEFFRARGHAVIPSARLVPENDPTTLFTSSGMQPLVPYLLGQPHPQGSRVVDSQKSFRSQDIEEIGDNRHTTFFEMLGNWSFGDYFKKEQLPWFYQFLTQVLKLDPSRLYVTAFSGDPENNVPRDDESAEIWKSLFAESGIEASVVPIGSEEDGYKKGMQGGRIFFYDAKKNWWSRAGVPAKMPPGEPGGPDSEVFYDFGSPHDASFGAECHPNCDCGRFMEIGNSVFMEYVKTDTGFAKLPKANVDFGGGLERLAAAVRGQSDVFLIDTIQPIVVELAARSGKNYNDPEYQKSFRIVADHARAATFMLADGVLPANTDQGYVLRRLLRRAIRHLDRLGVGEGTLTKIAELVIGAYANHYPELASMRLATHDAIRDEETRFRKTLSAGLKEFDKLIHRGVADLTIAGIDAFALFSTFGFPYEMTEELAKEKGMRVDHAGFDSEMAKHQQESRVGAAQKFAGGLADHSEQTVKYHTTHHLLLRALREVLGPEVHQRGSNITSERLRIDFSSPRKMTKEEIALVEEIVNQKIAEGLPVMRTEMPKEEAEKLGAEHEFGVKYPPLVSVYSVGPQGATAENPRIGEAFSIEFCGGPHVTNTAQIGGEGKRFKIVKEEAVAAGIRRIKAVVQ